MSMEENKTTIRRVYEESLNTGNMALIDEFHSPNHILYTSPENIQGSEAFKQFVMMYRSAFPDLHFTIEDILAEGDKVVTRYTAHGTHSANFQGIAPTNKRIVTTGIAINRLAHGRIMESWLNFDALGMLQQLGVVPRQEHA